MDIHEICSEMKRLMTEVEKILPEDIQWIVKPEAAEAFAQMVRNGVISLEVILDNEDGE